MPSGPPVAVIPRRRKSSAAADEGVFGAWDAFLSLGCERADRGRKGDMIHESQLGYKKRKTHFPFRHCVSWFKGFEV